ncbi:N-acetylmuramoyl-L-alanine amidase [Alkalimonas collagenimarina]|uniref:N-acetylmuramoyl-L-alanine amidase n=1 Tax=Alkalimonas collagenimarina TaxID=400390 RepID=A0ABT9GVK8_9GAMM|nr:N-acetylmuramoyl-L-alanine amidase [Alkalimonas collagenimarina]MDP4535087.1 N-acetylmuramoyl-L-alanine amidase [Alkalimonas collagenimarina]
MKNNNNNFGFALFCLLVLSYPLQLWAASNEVQSIRIWPSPENTRVVFDLAAEPAHNSFALDNPDRFVIDLRQHKAQARLPGTDGEADLITSIRSSYTASNQTLRIVLDLSSKASANVFSLPPTGPYGHRLVVDFKGEQRELPVAQARAQRQPGRDIIIAIDAGHGGEDPGSIGPSGTFEKNLVLPISRRLAELINNEPGMKAVLVRTGDYFVHLNRRTDIARELQADLLVSIHADAFTSPQPRGAAVWVLSLRRATSEVGRMLEQKERHSELLGGVGDVIRDSTQERYLAQTVLDLSMNHSMVSAHQAATHVLTELGQITRLHRREPQAASLAVLRSPDIPSILVEVGFISNPQEEQQLRTAQHQQRLAQSMFQGLRRHFRASPPADSLFAQQRTREYRVQRGDSLSIVAQRHNVSVDALRQHNQLNGDTIRIGQVLRIPD